ncbi:GMC family oxidoreductase N-terminal domain-containing protein [Solirubrobacter soli]|uniref:GMC family oxidoreductase N-terminal domain-containing protein n=1 Tax=Solirubrobacter soli TaxID=363832 RepID=UPI00041DD61C|nr:GMC family oxidoreductase [Solirubrobacter soli]
MAHKRLAAARSTLGSAYDIVIVGSGYGGAVTAARLGCANQRDGRGLRIAVLERGAERRPVQAPENQAALLEQLRTDENPLGFYDIRRFDTVDVIQGCALGGTSLNNMNVAIVPDREVFQESWPAAIRDDEALDEYYARARRMLDPVPWRDGRALRKTAVFDAIADRAGTAGETLEIAVSAEDRVTRYGVERHACVNCGDCCMGCSYGAKNSLPTNYLPMARHFGVELFTGVEVDRVEADAEEGYRLVCRVRSGATGTSERRRTITARRVVLSAGSLGSTGILLRSRSAGLSLSERLGHQFSGNGDNFSFAYNTDERTDAQGFGRETGARSAVVAGPSITSMMRFGGEELRSRFAVQDLTAPRSLVDVFRLGFIGLDLLERDGLAPDALGRRARDLRFNTGGAMNHSLGFLLMGHDRSDGRIVLGDDGEVRIDWPTAPDDRIYTEMDDLLEPAVEALGGSYLRNPVWSSRWLGNNLITAHPLGGCATADDAGTGVVDDAGRVFDGQGAVHPGLYVIDGAVIPRALGVNPFLTISMFAERAAEHLRRELELPAYDVALEGDDRLPGGAVTRSPSPPAPRPVTLPRRDHAAARHLARLRVLAADDGAAAQDQTLAWIGELGAGHDADALAELFALGAAPSDTAGERRFVTTVVGPLVDTPVGWLSRVPSGPARALVAGRLKEELAELVPGTMLGRMLLPLPLAGNLTVGYFTLRRSTDRRPRHRR